MQCPAGAVLGGIGNGSSVYFTSKAALTKDSYTGPEPTGPEPENPGTTCTATTSTAETLTDLTPDAYNEGGQEPNGASVLGVVGASEDGSYVYFVAEGHLAGGALGGQPNLYVWHEDC